MKQKTAYLGLFTAVAIIFGYVETLIPVFAGIPGIKLGLANLSVLFILERYSLKEATLVSAVRILVIGFLFGNMFSILYSLAGAALSLIVMTLMKKFSDFSIPVISVAGGVTHNVGQLLVAMVIVENTSLLYYAPALLVSGVITGLLIGWLTDEVQKKSPSLIHNLLYAECRITSVGYIVHQYLQAPMKIVSYKHQNRWQLRYTLQGEFHG